MDARTLARLLKVDYVTVNDVQEGDIAIFDSTVAVITKVEHRHKDESMEQVLLHWSSDGDTGIDSYGTFLPGSRRKWSTVTIISRDALKSAAPKSSKKSPK